MAGWVAANLEDTIRNVLPNTLVKTLNNKHKGHRAVFPRSDDTFEKSIAQKGNSHYIVFGRSVWKGLKTLFSGPNLVNLATANG